MEHELHGILADIGAISISPESSRAALSRKDANEGRDVVVCCLETVPVRRPWRSVVIRGSSGARLMPLALLINSRRNGIRTSAMIVMDVVWTCDLY